MAIVQSRRTLRELNPLALYTLDVESTGVISSIEGLYTAPVPTGSQWTPPGLFNEAGSTTSLVLDGSSGLHTGIVPELIGSTFTLVWTVVIPTEIISGRYCLCRLGGQDDELVIERYNRIINVWYNGVSYNTGLILPEGIPVTVGVCYTGTNIEVAVDTLAPFSAPVDLVLGNGEVILHETTAVTNGSLNALPGVIAEMAFYNRYVPISLVSTITFDHTRTTVEGSQYPLLWNRLLEQPIDKILPPNSAAVYLEDGEGISGTIWTPHVVRNPHLATQRAITHDTAATYAIHEDGMDITLPLSGGVDQGSAVSIPYGKIPNYGFGIQFDRVTTIPHGAQTDGHNHFSIGFHNQAPTPTYPTEVIGPGIPAYGTSFIIMEFNSAYDASGMVVYVKQQGTVTRKYPTRSPTPISITNTSHVYIEFRSAIGQLIIWVDGVYYFALSDVGVYVEDGGWITFRYYEESSTGVEQITNLVAAPLPLHTAVESTIDHEQAVAIQSTYIPETNILSLSSVGDSGTITGALYSVPFSQDDTYLDISFKWTTGSVWPSDGTSKLGFHLADPFYASDPVATTDNREPIPNLGIYLTLDQNPANGGMVYTETQMAINGLTTTGMTSWDGQHTIKFRFYKGISYTIVIEVYIDDVMVFIQDIRLRMEQLVPAILDGLLSFHHHNVNQATTEIISDLTVNGMGVASMVPGSEPGIVLAFSNDTPGEVQREIMNSSKLRTKILNHTSTNLSTIAVADTMDDRNAMVLHTSAMVLVRDPRTGVNADFTVLEGSAVYFYDIEQTRWFKIAEVDDMVTGTYEGIVGRPQVTAEEIVALVNSMHTHINIATLDDITTDGGYLAFNGVRLDGSINAIVGW